MTNMPDDFIDEKIIPFKWEMIDLSDDDNFKDKTLRVKVFGGWIVRTFTWLEDNQGHQSINGSSTFINDPNHEWKI